MSYLGGIWLAVSHLKGCENCAILITSLSLPGSSKMLMTSKRVDLNWLQKRAFSGMQRTWETYHQVPFLKAELKDALQPEDGEIAV